MRKRISRCVSRGEGGATFIPHTEFLSHTDTQTRIHCSLAVFYLPKTYREGAEEMFLTLNKLVFLACSLFKNFYLFFYWRIIALQNFVVFCQISSWISHQVRSVAQSCPTLCHPMNRSTPGLPVLSYLFAFSYCSWGSQGKNTEVVCHSLLQWTTFCQTSPPWPICLGWPYTVWPIVSLS